MAALAARALARSSGDCPASAEVRISSTSGTREDGRTFDEGGRIKPEECRSAKNPASRVRHEVEDVAVAFTRLGRTSQAAAHHLEEELLAPGRSSEDNAVDSGKGGGGADHDFCRCRSEEENRRAGEGERTVVDQDGELARAERSERFGSLRGRAIERIDAASVDSTGTKGVREGDDVRDVAAKDDSSFAILCGSRSVSPPLHAAKRERERTCVLLPHSDGEVSHFRLVDCFGQTGRREIAIGRQLEWREIQQFPEVGRREQHVRKSAPQSSVTVHQM